MSHTEPNLYQYSSGPRDLAGVLLKEGKYGDPTPQQREEMKSAPPVNRPSESAFGMYDYFLHAVRNASHFTYSGMAAGKMQGTISWLKNLSEPVLHVLCAERRSTCEQQPWQTE